VARAAAAFAVASPIWLLLLVVLPAAGAAPLGAFMIATGVTVVLAWAGLRWIAPRRDARPERGDPADRAPAMPAGVRRLLIATAATVALVYLLFVLRAG
jgi:hypothetical protein